MSLSRNLATIISRGDVSVQSLTSLLAKYGMLSLLPSIRQALLQIASHEGKKDTIIIETPFYPSEKALHTIKHIVGGQSHEHTIRINKKILAGFKARFQGTLYDGSAERIMKQLIGNREININDSNN